MRRLSRQGTASPSRVTLGWPPTTTLARNRAHAHRSRLCDELIERVEGRCRPLCTGGNYAQMRSVRVPWPRICAACTSTWPTRPRHSFRAHESRVAACGLHVLWSLATAVPGRDWWQLRSTRSNASIREACRLFKAGEQSRDELGHRLSHEINSRWRWAARGLLVPKTMQRSRNTLRAVCPGGVVRRRLGSAHSHDLRIGVYVNLSIAPHCRHRTC